MDKLYIDTNEKKVMIDPPIYGKIELIVQNGKIVRYEVTESKKLV